MKREPTIIAIIVGLILLVAREAGVAISENELNSFVDVLLKLGQVAAWIVALIKGKVALGTTIFGKRK